MKRSEEQERLEHLEHLTSGLLLEYLAELIQYPDHKVPGHAKLLLDYFAKHGVPYATTDEDGDVTSEYVPWSEHLVTGLHYHLGFSRTTNSKPTNATRKEMMVGRKK